MAQFGNYGYSSGAPMAPNPGMQPPRPNPSVYPPTGYSALSSPMAQSPVMPGRMVENAAEIKPNEVPMDGSIALFMLKDLSAVHAKAWNSSGTIDTVVYVPERAPQQPSAQSDADFQAAVFARLDSIEQALRRRPNHPKKPNNQARKEE